MGSVGFLLPSLPESRSGLLEWGIRIAHLDGALKQKERLELSRLAEKCAVDTDRFQQLLDSASNGASNGVASKGVDDPPDGPKSARESREWLVALIDVALADGQLHRRESDLLLRVAKAAEVTKSQYMRMLRQGEARVVRATREAKRAGR